MSEPLPELLDAKHLQAELGVTRAAAEAIMRQLPSVQIAGLRKSYVRRDDVAALLERSTFSKDQVPGVSRAGSGEAVSPNPATAQPERRILRGVTQPLGGERWRR